MIDHTALLMGARLASRYQLTSALRAVIELHAPVEDTMAVYTGSPLSCRGCNYKECVDDAPWPCDTISAITTALHLQESAARE